MTYDDLTPEQKRKINQLLANTIQWDVKQLVEKFVRDERRMWAEAYFKKHRAAIKREVFAGIDPDAIAAKVRDEMIAELKEATRNHLSKALR